VVVVVVVRSNFNDWLGVLHGHCIMRLFPLFTYSFIFILFQWKKTEKQRTHSVCLLTWQKKRDC